MTDLSQDVTIEMSYAGLVLTDAQIDHLVIYNATRGEYLPTTVDRSTQVAIVRTRRFSTFALAQVTAPIPRAFLPFAAKASGNGSAKGNGADTQVCTVHNATMKRHENEKGTWYSHKLADGTYCNGKTS